MFFDLSPLEIVVLLGLSVVLFGPDKLPAAALNAARILRQIRSMADSSRAQVREQLGPEFADLNLQQLDPRRFVREHLGAEGEQLRGLLGELDPRSEQSPAETGAPREEREPLTSREPSDAYADAT